MKKIITLLFFIVIYSCQGKKRDWNLYVEKPNKSDTLCITDIDRAKKDIYNGKLVFTEYFGFGSSSLRYENELKKLCSENGLIFKYDVTSCMYFEGQTQGCYGLYMDKILKEKFGNNFKEKLHKRADSLLLINAKENDKIIISWDCDKKPKLVTLKKQNGDFSTSIKIKNLDIIEDQSEYGGFPFFDISFVIERDSTINSFYINNYVPRVKENEKYKSDLFEIAVEYLKKNHPIWIPGEINGTPVRTENNVRIFFDKE